MTAICGRRDVASLRLPALPAYFVIPIEAKRSERSGGTCFCRDFNWSVVHRWRLQTTRSFDSENGLASDSVLPLKMTMWKGPEQDDKVGRFGWYGEADRKD